MTLIGVVIGVVVLLMYLPIFELAGASSEPPASTARRCRSLAPALIAERARRRGALAAAA